MLAFHERNVQKQMAALQSVAEHGGQILIEYRHRMFDAPAAVGMVHAVAAKAVAVDDGKVRHRREVNAARDDDVLDAAVVRPRAAFREGLL